MTLVFLQIHTLKYIQIHTCKYMHSNLAISSKVCSQARHVLGHNFWLATAGKTRSKPPVSQSRPSGRGRDIQCNQCQAALLRATVRPGFKTSSRAAGGQGSRSASQPVTVHPGHCQWHWAIGPGWGRGCDGIQVHSRVSQSLLWAGRPGP
jgi:hypothetical protein